MRTRISGLAALAALALGLSAPPVLAAKGDQRVQFGLIYEIATDDLTETGQTLEVEDDLGFQVSYEYRLTDLIGIEPGVSFTPHEIDIEFGGTEDEFGDIDFRALTANLNFHVLRGESIGVFLGPTVGYTFWSDFEGSFFPGDFSANDDVIYGANVGLDVPCGGGRWSFTGSLTYLVIDIELEGASTSDLPFDPLQVRVGASFHF
jgi:hypothetical protein